MIEIYLCGENVRERLKDLLDSKLKSYEILKTESGKPYLKGDPLCFSYSHSGDKGLIAISENPVGADLEIYKNRTFEAIITRFTERERGEIAREEDFLRHWTAREAYVKLFGLTLAETLKRIEFFDGKIFIDGLPTRTRVRHYRFDCGIGAICTEE